MHAETSQGGSSGARQGMFAASLETVASVNHEALIAPDLVSQNEPFCVHRRIGIETFVAVHSECLFMPRDELRLRPHTHNDWAFGNRRLYTVPPRHPAMRTAWPAEGQRAAE
jgi:hypothetical protein